MRKQLCINTNVDTRDQDVEQDEHLNSQEVATASSRLTNADIASLLRTLTASINKISSNATANSNPPSQKQGRLKYLRRQGHSCRPPLVYPIRPKTRTRNSWIAQYRLPEGDEKRFPKLDSIIKKELPKEALEADHKLSWLQNFVLDVAGPLMAAYDELVVGEHNDKVQQTVQLTSASWGIPQPSFLRRGDRKLSAV